MVVPFLWQTFIQSSFFRQCITVLASFWKAKKNEVYNNKITITKDICTATQCQVFLNKLDFCVICLPLTYTVHTTTTTDTHTWNIETSHVLLSTFVREKKQNVLSSTPLHNIYFSRKMIWFDIKKNKNTVSHWKCLLPT